MNSIETLSKHLWGILKGLLMMFLQQLGQGGLTAAALRFC